ncbi:MAG: hypothetical protein JWQ61_338 [Collimonas fungivorans]|jgi:hypothetical protein|nr:hypothetical protein [Collimonas fungivorans]
MDALNLQAVIRFHGERLDCIHIFGLIGKAWTLMEFAG